MRTTRCCACDGAMPAGMETRGKRSNAQMVPLQRLQTPAVGMRTIRVHSVHQLRIIPFASFAAGRMCDVCFMFVSRDLSPPPYLSHRTVSTTHTPHTALRRIQPSYRLYVNHRMYM